LLPNPTETLATQASQRGAYRVELAIIISYPTNESGIIVLLMNFLFS